MCFSSPSPPQPVVQPPAAPPQQAQAPDVAVVKDKVNKDRAGGMAASSPNNTMLTGPAGVDPTVLALGKNTLLGA